MLYFRWFYFHCLTSHKISCNNIVASDYQAHFYWRAEQGSLTLHSSQCVNNYEVGRISLVYIDNCLGYLRMHLCFGSLRVASEDVLEPAGYRSDFACFQIAQVD